MPLKPPVLEDKKYADLVQEALARIPVHNPEWTNFSKADPGVTLLELFAFMTETLLYRANLIPERNRLKFLSLLGMGLQEAQAASGLVSLKADALEEVRQETLLRAGSIPFRATHGLKVLPLEARVFYKQQITPDAALLQAYQDLYASYPDHELTLYQVTPILDDLLSRVGARDSADGAVWLGLFLPEGSKDTRDAFLKKHTGEKLTLGVVPSYDLKKVRVDQKRDQLPFTIDLPSLKNDQLTFRTLPARLLQDTVTAPFTLEVTLPTFDTDWNDLDPLEAGVGLMPPDLEDTQLKEKLLGWLRINLQGSEFQLAAVQVNGLKITQEEWVYSEILPDGTGEPDQVVRLSRAPVLPRSVAVHVRAGNETQTWTRVNDLHEAAPEVILPDPTLPPAVKKVYQEQSRVFVLDAESGEIHFGNGLRGTRPAPQSQIRADYAYSVGARGNLGEKAISSIEHPRIKVLHSYPTWGGADAEKVQDAEKRIPQLFQHGQRAVTAEDFKNLTYSTPGIEVGRVELLSQKTPGTVRLLVVPQHDAAHMDAPMPDTLFLQAVCDHLDPRRLVTTEVVVYPPRYRQILVSIGLEAQPGVAFSQVQDDVKAALRAFLSPLPSANQTGWAMKKPVRAMELLATVNRVASVQYAQDVLLAEVGTPNPTQTVTLQEDEFPLLAALSISVGDPLPLEDLAPSAPDTPDRLLVSVPSSKVKGCG
ncbi:putative baseplate assembly protein [Deinococcus roseus]|uniref:Baseplate assembly protein n=1 Tax=Deinococcus roseus TaxID=392414 RepID=A0ABQ2CYG9_9DEIO|nr:putative baseplate assembly protein [Deinococcus roseus]GGJ33382.1 putative baseplate assembly protein [Deinococcus roseus]